MFGTYSDTPPFASANWRQRKYSDDTDGSAVSGQTSGWDSWDLSLSAQVVSVDTMATEDVPREPLRRALDHP